MKSLIIIFCVFFATLAQAQSKLYIFRATGYSGSAVGYSAFVDDTLVCKLNNNRYSTHDIKPGKREVSVQYYGKESKDKAESIVINVEVGKTYYVQITQQAKGLTQRIFPQEITESSIKRLLEKCKMDADCKVD